MSKIQYPYANQICSILLIGILIVLSGCGGSSSSETDTVNLEVNTAPVAQGQSFTIDFNTSQGITLSGSDIDGDTLSYDIVNNPSNGTLSGAAPSLIYTPNSDFSGNDSFTFSVSDGEASASGTISLTIRTPDSPQENTAPIAQNQSFTIDFNTAQAIILFGSDVDGDPLNYAIASNPSNGTLSGNAPSVVYTPNNDVSGNDSFTFSVNDGQASATGIINLTIRSQEPPEENTAPVAQNQSFTIDFNASQSITLSGSDVDGDPLSYMIASNPSNGALSGNAPSVTYSPTSDFSGNDSFTFEVNDGQASATGTISITINSPDPIDGELLFNNQGCSSCHNDTTPRNIWNGSSALAIQTAISTVNQMVGFRDADSPNGTRFSEEELTALANYISANFQPPDDLPGPPSEVEPLACNVGVLPSASSLHRLSKRYYGNILNQLFFASDFESVLSGIAETVTSMPADGDIKQNFGNMDSRVTAAHVDDYFDIASELAETAGATAQARIAITNDDCINTSPVSSTCAESLIRNFGLKTYRRPLNQSEVDDYLTLWTQDIDGSQLVHDVVFTLLMAPEFIYVFENNGAIINSNPQHLALTGYELATRLSLHFWQTLPDQELLNAAATGELNNDDEFIAQVDRLASDPRALQGMISFFEEWFKIAPNRDFPSTAIFASVYAGINTNSALYDAMRDEIQDLVTYHTWENQDSFSDLLTTDLVFAKSQSLADLYGVDVWDGDTTPSSFPVGQRSGVLTRSALLLQVSGRTNPVKRGARIRNDILCESLEVPPNLPSEAFVLPPVSNEQSTRERYHNKTSPPSCNACHSIINGSGFALEEYDGLGRYRNTERIVDDFGNLIGEVDVDTMVVPQITYGDLGSLDGSVALMTELAANAKTTTCLARQYFRYTYRKTEHDSADDCAIDAVRESFSSGSFIDAWKSITLQPEFKQRVLGELP